MLWIRALGRVRRNIVQRTGIARHVAQVFESLSFEQSVVVTHNVITFQVAVRQRLALVRKLRMEDMHAYEAAHPARTQLLWLLNFVVATYLATAFYIICLYAVAFSRQRENEWMLVAFLGIFMDVLVYHTISLFLKSCAKLLFSCWASTDGSTLAHGLGRDVAADSCAAFGSMAASGVYHF